MHLLVVGRESQANALVDSLYAGSEHAVTLCSNGHQAVAELNQSPQRFDRIILTAGNTAVLDSMEIAATLRTLGVSVPITLLSEADNAGLPKEWGSLPKCAIEGGAGGRILRCAMQAMCSAGPALSHTASTTTATGTPTLCFEYSAPCQRSTW